MRGIVFLFGFKLFTSGNSKEPGKIAGYTVILQKQQVKP